jgi:hypothetical protein
MAMRCEVERVVAAGETCLATLESFGSSLIFDDPFGLAGFLISFDPSSAAVKRRGSIP